MASLASLAKMADDAPKRAELLAKIKEQGDKVRKLKEQKAEAEQVIQP